jgi:hypothetical protein
LTTGRPRRSCVYKHHQPGPSVSLFRVAHPRQSPVQELFDKAKGVLQFVASYVGTPHAGQDRQVGVIPPQPELFGNACAFGKTHYLDKEQRSPHQRSRAMSTALGMILRDGIQVVPSTHMDTPILAILGGILLIWF